MRYFFNRNNTSDTSGISNKANSCDASKTSASVTRLSSYFSGLGRAFGRRVSSRDGKKILGIAGVRLQARAQGVAPSWRNWAGQCSIFRGLGGVYVPGSGGSFMM